MFDGRVHRNHGDDSRTEPYGLQPIRKKADHLGLAIGDEIGAILFRPENLEHVKGLLYGSNPYLFFTVAGTDENGIFCDIRKSISERTLAQSLDYKPITILGPFDTLSECRRFRDLLEENQETDSSALKELFRLFTQ